MDQNNQIKKTPLAGELPEPPKQEIPVAKIEPTVIDLNEPKDYSHLPVGTQASLNLDKKSIANESAANQKLTDNNIVPKSVLKNDYSKKFFKGAAIFFGVFVICFLIFIVLSATNLDTKLIKLTLYGTVTDVASGAPVSYASILIGGTEVAKTDSKGVYSAKNQNPGQVDVTVKADGYDDLTEKVTISKVLLDYSTKKDFAVKSSITGGLSGKFIPNTANYKFTNDKLIIGEKQYTIADDGTFNIPNIKVGEILFSFSSVNFKDISQTITVQSGQNKIPDFTLVPTGDIIGELKSYVKEDLVLNTKFYVENILQDQVSITEEGKFAIKDLEPSKKYKIRVTAEGYQTRDYDINISQGENQLFNFKLVENGVAVYPIREGVKNSDPIKIYRSDFDGSNQTPISDDTKINTSRLFYSLEDNKIYFQSTSNPSFERKDNGQTLSMPYSYNVSTGVTERLISNTSNLSFVIPNYIAKKLLNVYIQNTLGKPYALQVANMDGSNLKDVIIRNTTGEFKNLGISNDGSTVYYSFKNGGNIELYLYDLGTGTTKLLLSGPEIVVYNISENGNLVLASRKNPNTSLTDLILLTSNTNDLRTLKENIKGNNYQFLKGDSNKVIFYESRESRSNIYSFTIDRSQEDKITSLTPDYEIKNIYQESNLVFYLTNKGLLVLDINKPKNFKLVANNVYDYTN